MDREGDKKYLDEMISLTANREWNTFIDDLKAEIYQNQANILENSQNWDQVVFAKGWNKCLAYIITLRDRVIVELDQIDEAEGDTNADV